MRAIKVESYTIPAFLLAFIFCGAIVGETVSLSLVVSALGSTIISKLYLINGLLLLGLPLLFFGNIDRLDRGKLLSNQLLITTTLLFLLFVLLLFSMRFNFPWVRLLLIALYPVSYLSKTTLFLTFWTLANDIFSTSESKKTFPVIAAWGFAGALAGACAARLLIIVVSSEVVIGLWAAFYVIAWVFARKTRSRFSGYLVPGEDVPDSSGSGVLANAGTVLTNKLVRYIAILYFFIFVAVFCLDYLFWNKCHEWFSTSESIASFQFSFYLIHALATMGGLYFILPRLISKIGFSRILYILPMVLLSGALILFFFQVAGPASSLFIVFITVQFFRHLTFENAFSPIYQMFFAAIEKEKRGRAKTVLEGFVKPGAIITAGLLLMLIGYDPLLILLLVTSCGAVLILTAFHIRKTYALSLIPETLQRLEPNKLIAELRGFGDHTLMTLIRKYSTSEDADMRSVSVKLLAGISTGQALEWLTEIYSKERITGIKELIARSLGGHFGYGTKPFIEKLLSERNPRIRANAIHSLNNMHCNWKRHLKPLIRQLLFENNIRVQVEAARFLWETGDQHERVNVSAFLNSLLASNSPNRRSAGLFLSSNLKIPGWEDVLVKNLTTTSLQVFTKCTEVILRSASHDTKLQALGQIDLLSRKHIDVAGKAIESIGVDLWGTLVEFIPLAKNRRMVFELVKALRIIADSIRSSGKTWSLKPETATTIHSWIFRELENVYRDGFIWSHYVETHGRSSFQELLDDAIREHHFRFCEWAVNAMVLLDKRGVLIWRHNDIDIRELAQRMDLVEIIEGTMYQKIGSLVLPLLKSEPWEVIARIGKNHFQFSDEIAGSGLLYFILSDKRWFSLCALYALAYCSSSELSFDPATLEALDVLVHDQNKIIAQTAREVLEKEQHEDKRRSRALEYLERVLFFKTTPLFRNVSAEKLMRLSEICQSVHYERGVVISAQGEMSDHLYIVKTGSLKVVKSDRVVSTVLARIQSGETYGETGIFTGEPRSASAITEEKSELYVIRRAAFKKLLLEVPEIAYSLLEVMSGRLTRSGEELLLLKREEERTTEMLASKENFT